MILTKLVIPNQVDLLSLAKRKLPGYEYIQYSYSVKFSFTNIFIIGKKFNIGITLTAAILVITVES